MARGKARIPQGKKIQPAVTTLTFDMDSAPAGSPARYIDLSQCASIVNRRFYRQGLEWAVAGFTWYTQSPGTMLVSKIPDTWIAVNAWEKGFHAWNDLNIRALEDAESVKAKFTDFKVFMDSEHHTVGSSVNLIPRYSAGNDFTKGEWEMSQIVIPLADDTANVREDEIIWVGGSYPGAGASGQNAVSLIEGYAVSRALPAITDPNVPADLDDTAGQTPINWIGAIDNQGTEQVSEVLDVLSDENNIPPYPFENDGTHTDTQYPGGKNQAPVAQEHTLGFVTTTTVGGVTQMPGGQFKGGLIKLNTEHEGASVLQVHLVPGPHRGYMARAMQDV